MPRNGSGTYSRAVTPPVNGDVADADLFNDEMDDLATAITNSLAKNGETVPTANLPMGGFKLTGLGAGIAAGQSLRYEQTLAIATTGSANAYVLTSGSSFSAYATGMIFRIIPNFTNTGAATINIDSIGAKNIFLGGTAAGAGQIISGQVYLIAYDGVQFQLLGSGGATDSPLGIAEGRLTLTTAVPVTISDVTAATTIYYAPYSGNRIALYDGSAAWTVLSFSELSLAIPANTNTMHDVFAYNNSGVVAVEALAWTNDTTRATALTTQNGVLVKSGATTRRYLGSFRTTGVSGQTEDSAANRLVWNMYNRAPRNMRVIEATDSWNYSTGTWRSMNNSTANRLAMVRGLDVDAVSAKAYGYCTNSTSTPRTVRTGIGLDSTSAIASNTVCQPAGAWTAAANPQAAYDGFPGLGYHYLQALEYGGGTDTQTWFGDAGAPTLLQTCIAGVVFA